VRFRWWTYSPL